MQAEGQSGELRVGYHVAARLGTWQLHPSDEGWEVRAAFRQRDAYWIHQGPHSLVLRVGRLTWTWPAAELRSNGSIHVTSPPIEGVAVCPMPGS